MLVERDGAPLLALPLVPLGPGAARIAAVPGSYWPFRSFPVAADVDQAVLAAALAVLGREARALRIGPVYDDDPVVVALIEAARRAGWTVMVRDIAVGWRLDLAAQPRPWPRSSTLRKDRFHEKHLAAHGALDWRFLTAADWQNGFALLGAVERRSWIASRTDGRDAKFLPSGHGAFWRAAARDPAIAAMFHAALLTVDGVPAAFSFDFESGTTGYAIANSYDPAYARHSPGKLLYWRNLIDARGRGSSRSTGVPWTAATSG